MEPELRIVTSPQPLASCSGAAIDHTRVLKVELKRWPCPKDATPTQSAGKRGVPRPLPHVLLHSSPVNNNTNERIGSERGRSLYSERPDALRHDSWPPGNRPQPVDHRGSPIQNTAPPPTPEPNPWPGTEHGLGEEASAHIGRLFDQSLGPASPFYLRPDRYNYGPIKHVADKSTATPPEWQRPHVEAINKESRDL